MLGASTPLLGGAHSDQLDSNTPSQLAFSITLARLVEVGVKQERKQMAKNKSVIKRPDPLCEILSDGTFSHEGTVFPPIPVKLRNMVLTYRENLAAGVLRGNKSKAEVEMIIREEFRVSYKDAFQGAGGSKQRKNAADYFCSTLLGTDGVTAYQERKIISKWLMPDLRERIWNLSDNGHQLTALRQNLIDETYDSFSTNEERYSNIAHLLSVLESGRPIPSRSKKSKSQRGLDSAPETEKESAESKPDESTRVEPAPVRVPKQTSSVNLQTKEAFLSEVMTHIETETPSDSTDSEKKRLFTEAHAILIGALNEVEVLLKSARTHNRKESYRKEGVNPESVKVACEWYRLAGASMGAISMAKCPEPFFGKVPIELEQVKKIFRAVVKTHHPDHNPNGDIEKYNTANNHHKLLIAYNRKTI